MTLCSVHIGQIPPCEFIMPVSRYQQIKCNSADKWFSSPFYSGPGGYKMCLCINSSSRSRRRIITYSDFFSGPFLSLHVYLMKGEYDDKLSWPFFGNVIVQLMNQNQYPGCRHRDITVQFHNDPKWSLGCERVTSGDIAVNGCYENINQREVDDQYLKNDCLKFRVVGVELCFENRKPRSF